MAETKARERPLSPHLQIYRWPLPMMMSIAASHHRRRALFRHAPARLVADRGGVRPRRLLALQRLHQLLVRAADPVRLHLGADPSHARRHPPSDLGHRPRLRAERARVARAGDHRRIGRRSRCCSGSSATSSSEARDERSDKDMRTPLGARARPRLGPGRHRAFLVAAPDRGRQRAADHRLRRDPGVAARPQPGRRAADPRLAAGRDHHAAVHRHRSPITCGSACRSSSRTTSTARSSRPLLHHGQHLLHDRGRPRGRPSPS